MPALIHLEYIICTRLSLRLRREGSFPATLLYGQGILNQLSLHREFERKEEAGAALLRSQRVEVTGPVRRGTGPPQATAHAVIRRLPTDF